MMHRYTQLNPKRKLLSAVLVKSRQAELNALAATVGYGGNPEHKRNPGDFLLCPPTGPRPGKSLCDVANIYKRHEALELLKHGLRKGLVSDRMVGEWPKNVWAVASGSIALEAQLENPVCGTYHGYPMPESDPLAPEVLKRRRMSDV
ncbi:MAG: hypothetical protein LRY56_09350 [Burkholderiaceae bacterium]|nr:hypothetical protein [Burkholderiaceae bacterium]MCD8516994.1 hypothetical protein [Burkholderiaceae bacterium]MCD8537668.1 hypothetical protein [Burkholderiaceae bacterium]